MLQNPFAVRPSYTTLNALQLVHNPIPTLHGPSTILSQRSRIRLQFRHDALQRVRNPITTLYDPSTVSLQRRTTLLQRSTTRSRSLLQFHLQRHTTLPQPSTTRSPSHHNALRPFYSFVTTSYNPSTTLYNAFTIPSTVSFTTSYNPSTTLYDTFTIPSTVSLQCHTTLLRRSTTLLATSYNPPTTLYDPSTVSLQRRTTLLRRSTTLLGCGRKKGEKKNKTNARKRSGDRETGKTRESGEP